MDLEDFTTGSVLEEYEQQQDKLDDEKVPKEPTGEVSVMDFVEMVEHTPVGELEYEEADLLREIMASVAVENEGGQDAPMVVEKLFRRMIDEWEAAEDEEMKEMLQPSQA